MKKRNARILTALLLALCLLVGSVVALADDPVVTVTEGEKDGEVKVDIKGTAANLNVQTGGGGDQGQPGEDRGPGGDGQDQGNPNQGGQDQGNPNQGGQDQGNPNQGGQDQGNPNQGGQDQGNPNQGGQDQGNPNQGGQDQGNPNQGGQDQGNPDQGQDQGGQGNGIGVSAPGATVSDPDNLLANATSVIVTIDEINGNGGNGVGFDIGGEKEAAIHVKGDLTEKSNDGHQHGIQGGATDGGKADIVIDGDINNSTTGARSAGIDILAIGNNSEVEINVKGDIYSEAGGRASGIAAAAVRDGTAKVVVDGNVTVKGSGHDSDDDATYGVEPAAVNGGSALIHVKGDLTAVGGENTYGMNLTVDEGSNLSAIVEGTVSGDDIAVRLNDDAPLDSLDVVAWAVTENADGEIARAVDGNGDTNKDASAKLEAAIWYIAKVADSALTVTATKKTVDGTDYQVAHENDKVKLTFTLNEAEEGLDGILYNAEDKTAAKADEWGKNDDGSYWVKMLRGGGMLLGLSTHKHEKATRQDNVVAATCTQAGSYDEVVYCTACKQELSRTKKAVDPLAHTPAEAVRENITAAKPGKAGGYDDVVYCSVCKAELSRTHVDLPALPDEEKPAAQVALVYEPVDENAEVNGVKVADHPEAAEALKTIGEALDGENVTVSIPGAEKLMDAAEKARFDQLPVKDRLLVVLSALGFANDGLGDVSEGMSDDAKALSADIAERMEALPEADKQALLDSIAAQFPKGTVTVDGKACESFSIDLVIDRDGAKTYERYTFYNDGGAWKLYGIEKGAYKQV